MQCFANVLTRSSTPWFISDAASGKHRDVVIKKYFSFFSTKNNLIRKKILSFAQVWKVKWAPDNLDGYQNFFRSASPFLRLLSFVFVKVCLLSSFSYSTVQDLYQTFSWERVAHHFMQVTHDIWQPKAKMLTLIMFFLQYFGRRTSYQLDHSEDDAEVKYKTWTICLVSEWFINLKD